LETVDRNEAELKWKNEIILETWRMEQDSKQEICKYMQEYREGLKD
jgi:hypothetical protein